MAPETERYIEIAQRVAAAAQAHTLKPETALQFAEFILPDLLVELEIAKRLDARLSERIAAPQQPCEATICSSRWKAPEKAAKAKKKAAKKPRKKKGVKDGSAS